jgi:hypothetical protein
MVVAQASAERAHAADGIADAVMARIAAETSGVGAGAGAGVGVASGAFGAPAQVLSIGAARGAAAARRGAGRSRVQVMIAGGFTALAVAAAAAVWIQSTASPIAGSDMGAAVSSPAVVEPPVTPATSQSAKALLPEGVFPPSGVEVDEIDSPQHDVHVFEISAAPSAAAAAGHASSVVIMIEDPAGGGGAHP